MQLLSGERTQHEALLAAERAQLQFGDQSEVVSAFKYLGITFMNVMISSATCLVCSAAPAPAKAAGAVLHCRARCAVLGI